MNVIEDLIKVTAIVAAAIIILGVLTIAVNAKTLEQVNREINDYWAQQRFEAQQRLDEYYQEQQLEALRQIEQNTRDER